MTPEQELIIIRRAHDACLKRIEELETAERADLDEQYEMGWENGYHTLLTRLLNRGWITLVQAAEVDLPDTEKDEYEELEDIITTEEEEGQA